MPAGRCLLEGRAWSGYGRVERVDVSIDGGETWGAADLGDAPSEFAWRGWTYEWAAEPRAHKLCCRATDATGSTQPVSPSWNVGGYCNNAVQRVPVVVSERA